MKEFRRIECLFSASRAVDGRLFESWCVEEYWPGVGLSTVVVGGYAEAAAHARGVLGVEGPFPVTYEDLDVPLCGMPGRLSVPPVGVRFESSPDPDRDREEFTLKLTRAELEGLETAFSYAWRDMLDEEYGPAPDEYQVQVRMAEDAVGGQVRAAGWKTYGL